MLEPTHLDIKSRRRKSGQNTGSERNGREEMGAWKSLIILQIMASSGFFYCQCSDDEEAMSVMKRYACSGFDSKIIGIREENVSDIEIPSV